MTWTHRVRERLRMDPPVVLVERTVLDALTHQADPRHGDARRLLARLLDEYEDEKVLLRAVSTHLHAQRTPGRRRRRDGALAAIDPIHVAGQHRRAVDLMLEGDAVDDPEFALTLVILERHGIHRIATFDERFADVGLVIEPFTTDAP